VPAPVQNSCSLTSVLLAPIHRPARKNRAAEGEKMWKKMSGPGEKHLPAHQYSLEQSREPIMFYRTCILSFLRRKTQKMKIH